MLKLLKRSVRVLLPLLAVLLVASPVFAFLFSAPVSIQEVNGTAYSMIGVQDDIPTTWLVSQGIIDANGLDTAISPTHPHLVANDRLLTAVPLPANGQVNVAFTTGNTPVSNMAIIPGYNGYVTILDAAALELASVGFIVMTDIFIDTSAASIGVNLFNKASAIRTYVSAVNTISVSIPVTFASNTSDAWVYADDATYNGAWAPVDADAVTSGATCTVGQLEAGGTYRVHRSFLYFDTSSLPDGATITGAVLRIFGSTDTSGTDFDLVVTNGQPAHPADPAVVGDYSKAFYTGNGGSINTNTYSTVAYNDITLNTTGIGWISKTATTKLTLRSSLDIAGTAPGIGTNEYVAFHNFDAAGTANDPQLIVTYEVVSVAGVTPGEHDITVGVTAAAGTTLTLTVDALAPSSATNVGAIPDSASNWVLLSNSTPYMGSYLHAVGGILVAYYYPDTIIGGQVYSAGTVTVTNGDATVIGAGGAAWTTVMDNGLFKSADGVYYTISSVTSATTLELTAVYGGGTLGAQAYNMYVRLPDRNIKVNSRTADAGSTNITIIDAVLTQANDYWNGAKLTIITTTDGLAPQGESAIITDFIAATDELQFLALSAAVGAGDTYELRYDGIITWGANPGGVTMAVASLSGYGGSFADTAEETALDRLPAVPVSDWYGDHTVTKAATLANPLRSLVTMVSDNTTLTEIQVWRWYGVIILVVGAFAVGKMVRGHQGITFIAAGAIIGFLIAFDSTIFPLYLAVVSAGMIVGGLLSERSRQI